MRTIQSQVFLEDEGDSWFKRNLNSLNQKDFGKSDPIVLAMQQTIHWPPGKMPNLLEIGCGSGHRLSWIATKLGYNVYGVEPSSEAVEYAQKQGLSVEKGTADCLPYAKGFFDVVCFGFCLYLCDREDLFRIATEADRVLSENGWLIIHDFFALEHTCRPYHHRDGLFSFKMDYSKLFTWNPAYVPVLQKLNQHGVEQYTDEAEEWVATTVLRKRRLRQ